MKFQPYINVSSKSLMQLIRKANIPPKSVDDMLQLLQNPNFNIDNIT